MQEEVEIIISKRGFKLLSNYNKAWEKIFIKCPNGHKVDVYFGNFIKGHGCRECQTENKRTWNKGKLHEWESYLKYCRSLTVKEYRKHKDIINPLNFENGYDIDHIFSISKGFKSGIHPKIISSYVNLQMLPLSENRKKGKQSWITKEELFERYHNVIKNSIQEKI